MTLTYRASKGRLLSVFEQFFIQKYNHEHKQIQEQTPGKNSPFLTYFMPHNSVTLQPELVFDSALMFQTCSCDIT